MARLVRGEGWLVSANGFRNLRADAHHRIQGGHRLLKNHGDFAATHRAPRFFVDLRQVAFARAAALQHGSATDARSRRQQPHQRQRQHRLAAA